MSEQETDSQQIGSDQESPETQQDPQGSDVSHETIPMSDIEAAAAEQGWSPDKGDLNALEFLKNGRVFRDRLFDEVKELRQENAKVYDLVTDSISKQDSRTYANETEAWEAKFEEAVESGDKEAVAKLRANPPKPPVSQPKEDPKAVFVDQWVAENTWFSDTEMKADAMGFYEAEKIKAGVDDPIQILPKVLARIKKLYPNKFEPPKSNNENRGSGAEKGGRRSKGKGKGLQRSDLTEVEALHFDQFVKGGAKPERLLASIERARG